MNRKSIRRRISITARVTIWFAFMLAVIIILTFKIFHFVSSSILQKTIRGYLLSSVEENCDKIRFLESREDADPFDTNDFYIRYREGWLEVDDDFVDEINDVQSALYTGSGTMIYGKNPIARETSDKGFKDSRIYKYKSSSGTWYYIYDRKIKVGESDGLWIRGLVPLSSEERQINDIFQSVMFFVPILFFIGIAGSYLTVRTAIDPVRRIRQVSSEITRGTDLKRRIEIENADREVYDLAVAFNSMLDRLEHSFEAEQQFTSDASHELRTPTSVIMAQTELALEKERTPEEYRRALSVIARQGRRMNSLIGSMLEYTRLELRPENYPMDLLDYSELTEMTAQDLSMLGLKEIELDYRVEEGIFVRGNRLLLERLVQNLTDNAFKYGKEKGHISLKLARAGKSDDTSGTGLQMDDLRRADRQKAVLTVSDDGIGISEEEQKHIFERFYRGDPSRSSGGVFGAGLGLSMVKKIVEIHRGELQVSSILGEGTTFTVILDIQDPESQV